MYTTVTTWISTATNYVNSSIGKGKTKRKRLTYLAIGSVSILSISYLISYLRIQSKRKQNEILDAYFSESYHSARSKFRQASSKISISKQHAIVIDSESDLSIDLCYIPGDKESKHVLLHFSGTHGVEGYAGSAIQIHLLQNYIKNIINTTSDHIRPHILFIHTLNPFAMAMNRRWNKANIDLNRNCILNKKKWKQLRSRDPDNSGYIDTLLNPQRKPTWFRDDMLFWWDILKHIIFHGNLNRNIISGQYFKKDGLFYGGRDIAIEHDMLVHFLTHESMDNDKFDINLCDIAERLTIIDVHTGLGRYGVDNVFVDNRSNELSKLLPKYKDRICGLDRDNIRNDMYRNSEGYVHGNDGYLSLFTHSVDTLAMLQEFGTVSAISVFIKALRAENMAYHYSQGSSIDDEKQFYHRGLDVQQVFYPDDDPLWKNRVLNSGIHVFTKSLWR